eukprot:scaffold117901_cov29-Attheya_sp.AAC.2
MVYASTFWLNAFPPTDGVSEDLSPRAIVVGLQLDYAKHCQLEFGTYVQTHEEHDNSMATRTTSAIALRPTGNTQGGYYYFCLTTGRRINRNRWTPLPMPADIINRVHMIARRSGASLGLQFTDRDGNLIITPEDDDDYDSDDDESYHPSDDEDSDDDDSNEDRADHVPIAGVYDQETEEEMPRLLTHAKADIDSDDESDDEDDEMPPLQEHSDDYGSEDEDNDERK